MSDETQETISPLDDLTQEHAPAVTDPIADAPPAAPAVADPIADAPPAAPAVGDAIVYGPPTAQRGDERIAALETRVKNLITQNCLRESGR